MRGLRRCRRFRERRRCIQIEVEERVGAEISMNLISRDSSSQVIITREHLLDVLTDAVVFKKGLKR